MFLRPWSFRAKLGQAPRPEQLQDLSELLRRQGAIVEIEVSTPGATVEAMEKEGGAGPSPQRVRGLIDTGASISTVSEEVAQSAGLVQTGTVQLGGVGGSGTRPIYAARMALPEYDVVVDPIEIAGVSIPFADVQVLIGRDILKQLRLDYFGPGGSFGLFESEDGARGATPEEGRGPAIPMSVLFGAAAGIGLVGALWALGLFE